MLFEAAHRLARHVRIFVGRQRLEEPTGLRREGRSQGGDNRPPFPGGGRIVRRQTPPGHVDELRRIEQTERHPGAFPRPFAGIAGGHFRQPRRHLGRQGRDEELAAVKRRFVELLQAERDRDPAQFESVAGARAFLEWLRAAGWGVALATGGWEASARLKLEAAGLDMDLPWAHADDAMPREDIVGLAIRRASRRFGIEHFEKVVSLGDGTWDLEVARRLGLAFVGVTAESDADALRAAGAGHTLADYSDAAAAHAVLEASVTPV